MFVYPRNSPRRPKPVFFSSGSHCTSNVYILARKNEFPEIIYAFFGGRQNIFSTIFGTKFVVICAAKILKIGKQIKNLCPKLILNRDFALAREIIQDHKLLIQATVFT